MILGITGGSGCGKTTLLNLIQTRGGLVLDCDAIYHELLCSDPALLDKIETRFPHTVTGGVLDRKKLGQIVFSDENALLDLNRITHAAVKQEVLRRLEGCTGVAAIDAIGLFEGGLAELCRYTVAVTAPESQRIARLIARDGISAEYAEKRIHAQKSNEAFSEKCDFTLENNTTPEEFQDKCLAFLREVGIINS